MTDLAEYVRIVPEYEDDGSGEICQTGVIIDEEHPLEDVEYGSDPDERSNQEETNDWISREDFWPDLAAEASDLRSAGGHVLELLEVRVAQPTQHRFHRFRFQSVVSVSICSFGFGFNL